MTMQDRAYLDVGLTSVFCPEIFIYMYIYFKYNDNVYCCYMGKLFKMKQVRHWRVNGKCLIDVQFLGRIWRRNHLFYVKCHWKQVCCGYQNL